MAEFGKAHIPISEVAEKYFGLNDKEAKLKAARAKFPFPVFKCSTQDGQNKCPWLVDIADLASYLDAQKEKSKKEFNAAH